MELKKKLLKQLRLEISYHCYVKVYIYNNGFLKGRTWTGQGARSGVKIWPFWMSSSTWMNARKPISQKRKQEQEEKKNEGNLA